MFARPVPAAIALGLTLLTAAASSAAPGPSPSWDDEFVGPFSSWANAKSGYGAKGDGITDDTLALQAALDALGAPGHPPVLYLPAGTYRITATLVLSSRINVGIIGADPATTVLRWAGPSGGTLVTIAGVAYSRINRLSFEGAGRAAVLVDQAWTCSANYFDTGNEYADDVFRNAGTGLRGGNNGCGFAETSVWRSQFQNLTTAGIALKNFNALDLWVWYSRFDQCAVGLTNNPGAGNFHVYDSVFRGSTVSDIYVKNTGGFNIRNNTSIGSKAFFTTPAAFAYPATITVQGNAISTVGATPIRIGNQGPALVMDNTIVSAKGAPAISVGFDSASGPDGDALLVGNRTSTTTPSVVKGRSYFLDNTTSSKLIVSEPPLPPTPKRVSRTVFNVNGGAGAAEVQQAINSAWQIGQRAVVHLPAGTYPIDTTLTIPANADIQVVGDGQTSSLQWTGAAAGPVLRILGPTHVVLRDFAVNGAGAVDAVDLEQSDQPGSRLYLDEAQLNGGHDANLRVDGVDYLTVDGRDIGHGFSGGASVTVVGGPLAAGGAPKTADVNIYSGASCCDTGSTYALSNGGSLMVRDTWYENGSAGAPFATATGGGQLTFAGSRIAVPPAFPSVALNDFRGLATFLTGGIDSLIRIAGNASGAAVFGDGLLMGPGITAPVDDTSAPGGAVALQQMRVQVAGGTSATIPDVGGVTPAFVRQMLAQTRREQPPTIGRLPNGTTDVRLYRVVTTNATVGLLVTP